ncbi:hypothetical protein HHK36_002327 [Tetracentron sinense]|uniref:Serine aminopeptidase S33 domain-containing protein n=1 Tax=Tetracentron sinense TaxID=13715 RepID=A0A834ZVK0_TETSI|nr:hypothetical protein HHK36_002327 [Tetracentron sinense]
MLLHIVRGAQDYKDLRTINEVEYPTFKAACKALGLLEDDNEWDQALTEATIWGLHLSTTDLSMFELNPSNEAARALRSWISSQNGSTSMYQIKENTNYALFANNSRRVFLNTVITSHREINQEINVEHSLWYSACKQCYKKAVKVDDNTYECKHCNLEKVDTTMRAEYNPDQYLWEADFTLAGRKYKRQDLEASMEILYQDYLLFNISSSGMEGVIPCSAVITCLHLSQKTLLYLVLFTATETGILAEIILNNLLFRLTLVHLASVDQCSGCRADANEAAVILLPSNITVFTLDFSGSGLSDGDYVSLGWHEKDDLKIVVSYLRSNTQVSCIGLWGRSMGAVTSLLYGAEDPSIAGMVLDSAFSNLFDLMMELVDVYKIRLPKFTVKMAVQYMRRVIQKKAKFDIMDLNCIQAAPKTFIPALFGHASEDIFIQPRHSDLIFKSYAGDKNIIKFDGDHNSPRPQFYYDSVSIFFYNVLHPPQVSSLYSSKLEKYYDLGDLKVGAGMDESLLYEIITGLRTAGTDAASSSSAPPGISTTQSVSEFLSEIAPVPSVFGSLLDQDNCTHDMDINNGDEPLHLQDKTNSQNEECCSFTSSNRESWGRCSSLGGSDEESSSADCTRSANSRHQMTLKALATPLRRIQRKSSEPPKEKKKKAPTVPKPKRDKFDKLEALSQRLRHCILRRVNHRRHRSS